ncbi:MAG: hypothetical protein ACT4OJ_16385 [Bacteroidota bacterium]
MTSQMRKTAFSVLLGALMVCFVFAACNNKKDKKDDTPKEDTTKVDMPPPPPPMDDTAGMDKDTADTRPVKPGE